MPFVFLAAVAAAGTYLLRLRTQSPSQVVAGPRSPASQRAGYGSRARFVGVGGWLLLYMVGLAAELAHGLALTVGSLIIYAQPSLAGPHSFIPLWALMIYVVMNLGLVTYGMTLFVLMSRGRRAAIAHNLAFNVLSVVFLLVWFLLSAKSPVGTVVDAVPGIVAIAYFSRSRRVRNTFTAS